MKLKTLLKNVLIANPTERDEYWVRKLFFFFLSFFGGGERDYLLWNLTSQEGGWGGDIYKKINERGVDVMESDRNEGTCKREREIKRGKE